ncbi:MAG: ORF6N domain-containing protein [Bacteroidota bacterium]|nr:ORF6N domain-containing protein [Bacteroidota bacterium]
MELSIIQSKIYTIRGQKVMLDHDLAELYGVETRVLNQAVKRNMERFPSDFMFRLTVEEWESMSSQFVMTSQMKRPKSALPLFFTEHGVAMLSAVLRSDIAINISIQIVRAFVTIRQALSAPQQPDRYEDLRQYMEEILIDQNEINEDTRMQLELINLTLAELQMEKRIQDKPRRPIGYKKPDGASMAD